MSVINKYEANALICARAQENKIKELQTQNNELSQYAHILSHDLRAPLRNISNLALMIERDEHSQLSEYSREYLKKLLSEAKSVSQLIVDLREISKNHLGNMAREEINLDAVLKRILEIHSRDILNREIQIDIGPMPTIYGNPQLIWQLFDNLIRNAVKHGSSPMRLSISGCRTETGAVFLIENPIDQDIDFPNDIFDFSNNQSKPSSTGIGLHVCKKIVDLHGGKITAQTQDGVFLIRFTIEENDHD